MEGFLQKKGPRVNISYKSVPCKINVKLSYMEQVQTLSIYSIVNEKYQLY